jgi:hypothetical protein
MVSFCSPLGAGYFAPFFPEAIAAFLGSRPTEREALLEDFVDVRLE